MRQLIRSTILAWADEGRLASGDTEAAMRIAGVLPDRNEWRRFIDLLLIWSGTVSLAAGVIFFFAYNWRALLNLVKFGLVEALICAAAIGILRFGTETTAGKAILFSLALLTGALLALFGQTYQTGADTYELFVTWAAAILPWTLVGRLPALWMLLVALLNLSIAMYFRVFPGLLGILFSPAKQLWLLFAFNSAALVIWEFVAHMMGPRQERWAPRLIVFGCGGLITALAVIAIFESGYQETGYQAAVFVYPLWIVALYFCYRYLSFDLFALAGGVLSCIVVISALMAKSMRSDGGGSFLLIGLTVIGLSAAGGYWLKNIAQEGTR